MADIGSWFSEATLPLLRSVTVTGGHAVVDLGDLRPVIAGADSGTGSRLLLSQLDATVFQFPSVTSAEYRLLGRGVRRLAPVRRVRATHPGDARL